MLLVYYKRFTFSPTKNNSLETGPLTHHLTSERNNPLANQISRYISQRKALANQIRGYISLYKRAVLHYKSLLTSSVEVAFISKSVSANDFSYLLTKRDPWQHNKGRVVKTKT